MMAATIATRGITRRSHRRAFDRNVLKLPRPFSICSGTDIAFFVDSEEYQSEMKDERFEMRSQYDFKKARTKKQKAVGTRQQADKTQSFRFDCLLLSAFSSFIPHPSALIPTFQASAASISASITFADLLTEQRTFQSAVIELAFPFGLTFPSSSR